MRTLERTPIYPPFLHRLGGRAENSDNPVLWSCLSVDTVDAVGRNANAARTCEETTRLYATVPTIARPHRYAFVQTSQPPYWKNFTALRVMASAMTKNSAFSRSLRPHTSTPPNQPLPGHPLRSSVWHRYIICGPFALACGPFALALQVDPPSIDPAVLHSRSCLQSLPCGSWL
jgi:hypothetical protein